MPQFVDVIFYVCAVYLTVAAATVPDSWHRFQFIADDELRAARGKFFCLKCNDQIPGISLREEDDRGMPGWNFDRLLCQHGHPLLVVESMHISVR